MKTNQNINNENLTEGEASKPESNIHENEVDDHKEVELDLSLISDSTSILETITFIQTDEGELFGDNDLYEELRNFIDTKGKSNSKEENLEDGKKLVIDCTVADCTGAGTVEIYIVASQVTPASRIQTTEFAK